MVQDRKNVSKGRRQRRSLEQQVTKAITTFEKSETHDAFAALLEYKTSLLVEDCASLSGNVYETGDVREAIFLLRYLFESPHYRDIDIAAKPSRRPGLFPNQGPFENDLINLSNRAAVGGKGIQMLFLLDDWVQSLASEDSSILLRNLLVHKVEVALAPGEHAERIFDGTFAVFHVQNQPFCICEFFAGSGLSESQRLTISYDPTKARDHDRWFKSLWALESVLHAKVL